MAHSSSGCEGRRAALVTGGSRGLGLAIARRLAADGWRVTIAARDADRLARAQQRAAAEGLELHAHPVDVTVEASVSALFAHLRETGPLHLCVNNAGRNFSGPLVKMGRDGTITRHGREPWQQIIDLCLTGVFLCGREAAAAMLADSVPGTIINIGSAVYTGAFGQSAYAAAKAGIVSLTRSWALELADYGIRVVALAPGVLAGEALEQACRTRPGHAAYMEALQQQVPLRRWADADEVASAVAFIASHTYITGTVLAIDGGGVPARVRLHAASPDA